MKKYTVIFISIAALVAAFLIGRMTARERVVETEAVRTEIVTITDTIRITSPVYITERIVDSIYVYAVDTLLLQDTVRIALPRMQREYSDSLYHAWVSGFQPALDSIMVYPRTQFITNTIREKAGRWHLGVNGGIGVGKDGLTPYVGVGITYSFISF